MGIRPRHWLTALGLAMVAHLGIAYWLQSSFSPMPAPARKSLSISLAPAGSAAADSPTATAPPPATVPSERVETTPPAATAKTTTTPPPVAATAPVPPAKPSTVVENRSEPASTLSRKQAKVDRVSPKPPRKPVEPPNRPVPSSPRSARSLPALREKPASSTTSSPVSAASERRPESTPAHGGAANSAEATPLPGNPKPPYPRIARSRGYEGQVVIQVSVTSAGTVAQAVIGQSSGHGILDNAALRTVKRWRFRPARRHGRPVSVTLEIPVTFRLQNG